MERLTTEILTTEVLVVGGGTGGTVAAIQAARRGAQTVLVSEFGWLGGMLTAAGVAAPDGNELASFRTGMWNAFVQELQWAYPQGLDHAWVSCFTYEPRVGAEIFARWVNALPNLRWISGQVPLAVERQGDRITTVHFPDYSIQAQITLDGTELGDLLALAEVPYRWGWDWETQWQEPSAPQQPNEMTHEYPVQAPTWVFLLQDYGNDLAPEILTPPRDRPEQFADTWKGYGAENFLNYGRLPGDRFMVNWPIQGNDYGVKLDRLVQSEALRQEFLQEAYWHSQSYGRFLQSQLGRRYGLADSSFPQVEGQLGGGGFALHPYYRESRRLRGLRTVIEPDILPGLGGRVAPLPLEVDGSVGAIALGNYPNDHHYPGFEFPLQPKSIRWGGRWVGTPFTMPYGCLVPETVDGLLVCEKNISVSHMANGATRLQPAVMGIGQAAGMAAALCVEQRCQPRDLSVGDLQRALLTDAIAPAALMPLYNLPPQHPDWLYWQQYYLQHPEDYPLDGNCPASGTVLRERQSVLLGEVFQGTLECRGEQDYGFVVSAPGDLANRVVMLITLRSEVEVQLGECGSGDRLEVWGRYNRSGNWVVVERLEKMGGS